MKTPTIPSFKSVVLNPKILLSLFLVGLGVVALFLTQAPNQALQETPNQEPAILRLQEARQELDKALAQVNEERGKVDTNPQGPDYPGTMQALYASWSVEMRTRVTKMIGDPKSPWYNHAPWEVYQSMRQDAIAQIVAGETAQKTTLTYVDPRTGKETTVLLDAESLMLYGTTRLQAINLAEYGGRQQKANLENIRSDIARQELDTKIEAAKVFEAEGKTKVAADMLSTDVYGGKIRPEQSVYSSQAQKELDRLKQYLSEQHNVVTGSPH